MRFFLTETSLIALIIGAELMGLVFGAEDTIPHFLAAREGICEYHGQNDADEWRVLVRYLHEREKVSPVSGEKSPRREHFELISYMTEDIHEYGSYASACMLWYTRLRDYGMSFYSYEGIRSMTSTYVGNPDQVKHPPQLKNTLSLQGDQRWQKVWLLHERVREIIASDQNDANSASHDTYVVWVDADVIVLDPHLRLERFCRSFPQSNFIVSRDFKAEHGLINSGFMILRANYWSLRFLEAWWSFDHDKLSDQGAFGQIWATDSLSVKKYTTLLDPEVLNTRFPAWFNLGADHKLLHLAGVHDEMRTAVFREGLTRICSLQEGDIGNVRQLLNRQDILVLLGRTRSEIMSHAVMAARELKDEEGISHFRERLQKALQMGFAGRQRQHETEDSEIISSTGSIPTDGEMEEMEIASIALRWVASQLDPSNDHLGPSPDQCEGERQCVLSTFEKEQEFLESLFELLDHLRFIPAPHRNSAIGAITAMSQEGQESDLLAQTKQLTTANESADITYVSLVISSLHKCEVILSTLHHHLLEVKPLLTANVLGEGLRRLLYYTYKLLDMQASIAGEWGWSEATQKESLLAALEILCALGQSATPGTNPVDVGVSALFALSDDMKEEAAAVMFAIHSITEVVGGETADITTGVGTESLLLSVPVFMEEVGAMWHLNFNPAKKELEEGANLPALAYQLLGQVWSGRVRPKHIETTMTLLADLQWKASHK